MGASTLTLTSYNCRGAMSAAGYIDFLMSKCNILCIQEHHLFSEHKSFLTSLNTKFTGYVVVADENIGSSAIRLRKGGLAILWQTSLDYCITTLNLPFQSDRISAIRVDMPNEAPLFIVNVYLPTTNTHINEYRDCIHDLQVIVDWLTSEGMLIIYGDFNGQYGLRKGRRSSLPTSARGTVLREFLAYNNMYSTVCDEQCEGPIYTCWPGDSSYNPSQIDHFVCCDNTSHHMERCFVHDDHVLNVSDHHPISLSVKCLATPCICAVPPIRYNWASSDKLMYTQNLRANLAESDRHITTITDIDRYVSDLQDSITKSVKSSVPVRKFRPYVRPFWDDDLRVLHREQYNFRQNWINEGRPRGPEFQTYVEYKCAKRRFARIFKLKQLEFYRKEYEDLENNANLDMKHLWKNVKPKQASNSTASINVDGTIYNNPDDLCDMWKHYYQQLLNEQPSEKERYDEQHGLAMRNDVEHLNSIFNNTDDATGTLIGDFTVNEIAIVCKGLPNNKASGYDTITYECVKYGGYELFKKLSYLFNNIVHFMYIPSALKHIIIIPLYKGKQKPKNSVNSYRGISLSPTLNKVFEKVILCRLKPWLKDQNFPPPLQQACREKTNCVCLVYAVQEAIQHMTNQGSKVYGCFLDIKSAYDVINWDGLLIKLAQIGITNKLWHLFQVWLIGSTAQISVHGQTSDTFEISRSIKQGGLLSTFFFVTFYHDIHQFVTQGHSQNLTFHNRDISSPTMADDTLLLSTTVKGLQVMIDNAFRYGQLWRLEYSKTKTKCIIFSDRKKRASDSKWYLGNQSLEEVTFYNYLGVILSADTSSKVRTTAMSKKGYSTLGVLKASGFHSDGLSPVTCSTIWQRMIIPSMLYGCEVWGEIPKNEMNSLETVQTRVGKHIQGLHRRTHNEIVRGLLGWSKITGTIDLCKLNFVYKLMSLPHDNIVKHIFLCQMCAMLFSPISTNSKSITCNLWTLLHQYKVSNIVVSYLAGGELVNKTLWKQIIKASVRDNEEKLWRVGLIAKGALRYSNIQSKLAPSKLYTIIKSNMHLKNNLMNIIKLLAYPEQIATEQVGIS